MITAYIGVGTNIDREQHAKVAYNELQQLGEDLLVSPIYECEPIGFSSQNFYNFVITLRTALSLEEFSHRLREIEFKWGREENAQKYQDRTLDLDIVLFGEIISTQKPELPRSDIYKYPFVTKPLYDLNPHLVIPGDGRTVADIWYAMQPVDSLKPVSFSL
ncbi:2-amino-4-hydroxy-6-hydroxymethyldihydropteridine diphosphokinase [Vibrio natriegens]|jgi:2-amino-4-hydroxy-6-hydroxymethyldihydropteridine diphosphokinase|uniref:2-amino-4-hydroxy-6- hydroxymethyldihydropteridine diphosphokinase n=1 Tax=Vibrio TaxID=662 RepID=UPI000243B6A5|nr:MULTISPECIES: 2-amino-4-hydroxy-6-hydroxymethyldihydropteridine diphosphokinase [Vibrio]AEX20869.1 2-amino-4-hydroxy-6-hydroxymethyldihydropteridine pyrophosphokinase [Vibrio sp. EJY3]ANQ20537.1 2-amino-4-hydroxy-6-hydroxymethyldihydropteridine diphosphokinase [Vibrio natriegens]ANQ25371.1 2-amino-4-hydroxy-6-hydroxymethyldihydropteridine diphosphokinase [Vibrio natriegens]MCY9875075.1 2-amino-4-hydroxy-6-hydroxymethyldihydropteridine diphosphokinase [Vibrio natriegens]